MTILPINPDLGSGSYPVDVKSLFMTTTALSSSGSASPTSPVSPSSSTMTRTPLLATFINAYRELQGYRNGNIVTIDGHSLSIPAVAAAARFGATVGLTESPITKEKVKKSRAVIDEKIAAGTSIYGVSTGFGGSADTRTDRDIALGHALLQHQHIGILPSSTKPLEALPLLDPLTSTSMPESWVRGAILIRMNSLIRGHSGVRWEVIDKMRQLLCNNITPMVPMRSSISASGDLSPLSYVAGTLVGNPSIRVFNGPAAFGARQIKSARKALEEYNIEPISLKSKEHLGLLNGTAFSASVASLAMNDSVHMAILAEVCTAMGTEALVGTRGSFDPFIHDIARPHPGQVEAARTIWDLLEKSTFAATKETEVNLEDDKGLLRQDRYPLRTAPQFIGPQIEDLITAIDTVTVECNSTTDNPLIDGETGEVHHGGNFQAMAVTNAMEKTRVALHHIGKLLFAQCTELINPTMNRGLPPSLAATDPSLNYHAKGLDIALASYVSELGYLASPVSTHIQSAEMHNQAINSLALISGRATVNALDVLTLLTATYLYILCQALDLRTLQAELCEGLDEILKEEIQRAFGTWLDENSSQAIFSRVRAAMRDALDSTSTMDAADRMKKVAASSTNIIIDFITETESFAASTGVALTAIPSFRAQVSTRSHELFVNLRKDYLTGVKGPAPASRFLNKTKAVYEYIRVTLGVQTHGIENLTEFTNGLGVDDVTIGQNISLIQEAIRDGKLQAVVVGLFD